MLGTRRPKFLRWVFVVATLCGGVFAGVYWHFSTWSNTPMPSETAFLFELSNGTSLSQVSTHLIDLGVLHRPTYFQILGRLTNSATKLQAGEYTFESEITPRALLQQLREGRVVAHSVRIREGVTVAQMLRDLSQHGVLKRSLANVDASNLAVRLGLQIPFVEGMFFPDTYQVRRGDSDRSVLVRAHQAMLVQLDSVWAHRKQNTELKSRYELLILGSIIEKESSLSSDQLKISQVFHNRLKQGMRLQTDPTVIYALGESFDGDLRRADLRVDSPFNTYRYKGLPPTPIALVSWASLQAAAHPVPGEFFYFVARGDGSSQFSRTLAEHNAAVRQYQLGR